MKARTLEGVPADRDEAEGYIFAELVRIADELGRVEDSRSALYDRRNSLYGLGRSLRPPVSSAAMARAARVTDAALVLGYQKQLEKRAEQEKADRRQVRSTAPLKQENA